MAYENFIFIFRRVLYEIGVYFCDLGTEFDMENIFNYYKKCLWCHSVSWVLFV
jgi:hypothetical protein